MLTPELAAPVWQLEAISDECFDPIYMAAVEATEESVLNAMLAAEDTPAFRAPHEIVRALPHDNPFTDATSDRLRALVPGMSGAVRDN